MFNKDTLLKVMLYNQVIRLVLMLLPIPVYY